MYEEFELRLSIAEYSIPELEGLTGINAVCSWSLFLSDYSSVLRPSPLSFHFSVLSLCRLAPVVDKFASPEGHTLCLDRSTDAFLSSAFLPLAHLVKLPHL